MGLILITGIALGPWLISLTVLTYSVRGSMQGALGPQVQLAYVGMGWRDGFQLERILIDDPPPGMPKTILGYLHIDTDLVDGLTGVATGNEVGGRMVVRHARFEIDLPLPASGEPKPEPSPEATPGEPPSEGPDLTQLPDLPCAFRPRLELEDLDFLVGWAPEGATPLKMLLLGLNGGGGGYIARDMALDLDQGIDMTFDEIVVESLPTDGPAQTLLWLEKPHFTATRLEVPSPRLASPLTATTAMRLEIPRLRVGDVLIREAVGTADLAAGVVALGLSAGLPIGTVKQALSIDVRDDASWPITLELGLVAAGLEGDLARTVPYLVPLLLASETPTGPGLPPLTLTLKLDGSAVFGPTGAVDTKASLNSLVGGGEFELAPGSLVNSRLIDGYAKALIGLGVFGLVDGIFPSKFEFQGAKGGFTVGDGKVVLPQIEIRSDALGLVLSGETRFDGPYQVNLKSLPGEGQTGGVWDLVRALDDAGGVTLRGSLLDGSVEPVLPDLSKLARAAQARGALDLLKKGVGSDLRAPLEDVLGTLGKD
jgi:hypothetical protein